MSAAGAPRRRLGALAPALLWAAAVAWQMAFPRVPGGADEAILLYGARRLLEGQVLYRDFFEFLTPGSFHIFAGLFALTGPSLPAAHLFAAGLNGASVVLAYRLARRVMGAAPALLASAGWLVVCWPVWRYASPHWLSTLLGLATAAVVVAERGSPRSRALMAGALAGLAFCVQQQRGAWVLVWMAAAWTLLALAQPRDGRWAGLGRTVAWGALGWLAAVAPVLGSAVYAASAERVVYALVTFVFQQYGKAQVGTVAWAGWFWMTHGDLPYTWIWLLRALPAALVLEAGALAVRAGRGWGRAEAVRGALVLLGAAMAASVLYYPDFIHVAYVSPFLFLVAARVASAAAALLPLGGARARQAIAVAAIAACGVALGWKAVRDVERAWRDHPATVRTAMGTLRVKPLQRDVFLAVRRAAREAGALRRVYVYPVDAWLYLALPADNPTPFSLLIPGYNTPAQFAEAVAALEAKPPEVLVLLSGLMGPKDPVAVFQRTRYRPVATVGPYTVLRRHAGAGRAFQPRPSFATTSSPAESP